MRIGTIGPREWGVFADWHGAERLVFRGDLFGCLRWRAANGG